MRCLILSGCLLLAACGDWPDIGGPTRAGTAEWPVLLPLDAILASPDMPEASDREAAALAGRAADLRRRAAILRGDAGDLDALREKLDG